MKLKIQQLQPNAVIPTYANPGDAGLDLTVTEVIKVNWFTYKIKFGIAIALPKDHYGKLVARSSIFKQGLIWLANGSGTIDNPYRGELMGIYFRIPMISKLYKVGERAAQLIIQPYTTVEPELVKSLSVTKRGKGGLGSTGK